MNVTGEMVREAMAAAWVEHGDVDSAAMVCAFLAKVADHVAAAERERLAAYISRAASRKREQAVGWWSADIVQADAWDEVAGWCRDETIWQEDS